MSDAPEQTGVALRDLQAEPVSDAAFLPYGRVIAATADGTPAGAIDRALDLSGGTPRFYIMDLAHRPLRIETITRHGRVTQVLAAVGGLPWLLAVAAPTPQADAPDLATLRAFAVPGDVALLLHRGTWHAGPYFATPRMRFFNLEATDTNVVDHDTCRLTRRYGVAFALREAGG
jgi:ureidoglycolate hydrolase